MLHAQVISSLQFVKMEQVEQIAVFEVWKDYI